MASARASTAGGTVLFVASAGSAAKPDIDTSAAGKRLCLKPDGDWTPQKALPV